MENKKSILITGATSGIGQYFTKILSERGWVIWAGYRNEEAKEELKRINPQKVFPIKIDVIDNGLILEAKRIIENSGYPLYAIINNAGIALGGPIELINIEEIKKLYEVNFFGNIRIIQSFLSLLRKNKGRIINIGSVGGLISIPFMAPYCSSKWAIESLSDILRRELEDQDMKVSLLEPGAIDTNIWNRAINLSENSIKINKNLENYQPKLDNFQKVLENYEKHSVSIEKLKKPIIHAIENKNPKSRYLIYKHNFILKFILKLSPTKLIDWFFNFYLK